MSSDLLPFQLAGGSLVGRDHLSAARNNQDAFAWRSEAGNLVAAVADGCSSGRHSEVGAAIGANLVVSRVLARLVAGESPARPGFWPDVEAELLGALGALATGLAGAAAPGQTVLDFFLFTLVGAAVTPEVAVVFAVGDGVFSLNGQVRELGPFAGNAPPYLAYGLARAEVRADLPVGRLEAKASFPAAELRTLVLGTDGALPIARTAGGVEALCADSRAFGNPDFVRRQLFALDRRRPGAGAGSACLFDDTTLVLIRRTPALREAEA